MKQHVGFLFILSVLGLSSACGDNISAQATNETSSNSTARVERWTPSVEGTENDPLNLPVEGTVDGNFARAFLISGEAFNKDIVLPADKKNLENYRIEFRQDAQYIFVIFNAKPANESEAHVLGGSTTLGKDVAHVIRKKDMKLVQTVYFK
jgi:hypothetical protein